VKALGFYLLFLQSSVGLVTSNFYVFAFLFDCFFSAEYVLYYKL